MRPSGRHGRNIGRKCSRMQERWWWVRSAATVAVASETATQGPFERPSTGWRGCHRKEKEEKMKRREIADENPNLLATAIARQSPFALTFPDLTGEIAPRP